MQIWIFLAVLLCFGPPAVWNSIATTLKLLSDTVYHLVLSVSNFGVTPMSTHRKTGGEGRAIRTRKAAQPGLAFVVNPRRLSDAVCVICEDGDVEDGDAMLFCDGPCRYAYHFSCLGAMEADLSENQLWFCSEVCATVHAADRAVLLA